MIAWQPRLNFKDHGKPSQRKMRLQEVLLQYSRRQKIFKYFWRNGSCMEYHQHKIQDKISKNEVHVIRLCTYPNG